MLLNNIELDVKTKCIEEGTTQTKIAEKVSMCRHTVMKGVDKWQGRIQKTRRNPWASYFAARRFLSL